MQSVRQQHQRPSDTVLDHAFSAVLGAIWLDCERQEYKVPHIRSTILEVLGVIDAIVDQNPVTEKKNPGDDNPPPPQGNMVTDPPGWKDPETAESDQGYPDDIDHFTREWFAYELNCCRFDSNLYESPSLNLQPSDSQNDCTVSLGSHLAKDVDTSILASSNNASALEESVVEPTFDGLQYGRQVSVPSDAERDDRAFSTPQNTPSLAEMTVRGEKRKRSQDEHERSNYVYQKMLQAEQQKLMRYSQVDQESLTRFLKHPILDKLDGRGSVARFLYLTIGSWETIIDFKGLIEVSRGDASACRPTSTLLCNAAAKYNEICRLENEEALCLLLKRYHIISLCEEEQLYNDHHSHIIMETPSTVNEGRVTKPGNPVFALESSLTERLLLRIMPDTDPRSADFQKARVKVKRLRKLAGRLRHLVKHYGVGILCLLPSGPSFKEMSLTDNMCVKIGTMLCM